jgi:hypothetical protein
MVSAGASTCPLGMGIIVHCREGGTCVALAHQLSRTTFAVAALGGNAQFQLDLVKSHACPGEAGNLAVEIRWQTQTIMVRQGRVADVLIINTN